MQVHRRRFEEAGKTEFKDLLTITEPAEGAVVADAGLVGRAADAIAWLLEQVPDETPVSLTVEADHATARAADDGRVIVETGIGSRYPDIVTELYRDVEPERLPLTMGSIASSDVRSGLSVIAEAENVVSLNGHLDSAEARSYLELMDGEQVAQETAS